MKQRTNELRKKRRNENYNKLRKIGYSARQATMMKNWSRKRVQMIVEVNELICDPTRQAQKAKINSVYGMMFGKDNSNGKKG